MSIENSWGFAWIYTDIGFMTSCNVLNIWCPSMHCYEIASAAGCSFKLFDFSFFKIDLLAVLMLRFLSAWNCLLFSDEYKQESWALLRSSSLYGLNVMWDVVRKKLHTEIQKGWRISTRFRMLTIIFRNINFCFVLMT